MLNIVMKINDETYDFAEQFQCLPMSYSIGKAEAKIRQDDVPYADGAVDTTNALISDVKYRNRTIAIPIKFVGETPKEAYSRISNLFSGQICEMTLDDDGWFYRGRVQVEGLSTSGSQWLSQLTMIAEPYKYKEHYLYIDYDPGYSRMKSWLFPSNRKNAIPKIRSNQSIMMYGKNLLQPREQGGEFSNDADFDFTKDGRVIVNAHTHDDTSESITIQTIDPDASTSTLNRNYTYILSGCPVGGGSDTYSLNLYVDNELFAQDTGEGAVFSPNEVRPFGVMVLKIDIGHNVNLKNVVFKPMIRMKDIYHGDTGEAVSDEEIRWEPFRQQEISAGSDFYPELSLGVTGDTLTWYEDVSISVEYVEGSL